MYLRVIFFILFLFYLPLANQWDIAIETYFYEWGKSEGTIFLSRPLLDFIYDWTVVPAEVVGFGALCLFLASYFLPRLKASRSICLYMAAVMAIGAGLIVHLAFKDHWGRPRPKQTSLFGGNQEYRPFYSPNFQQPEPSKSFPCGHCSMGFYFFALALALRSRGYEKAATQALVFAMLLGTALGITRMAQGGHYLSDVIATGFIMWWCSRLLEPLLVLFNEKESSKLV